MKIQKILKVISIMTILCATATAPALAQNGRNYRIVVGFPPGGTTDLVARVIAEQIRADGGPSFVVENRTGAGGRLAIDSVKNSEPDGTTVLLTPSSMMMVYPFVFTKLRYDPIQDFLPVSKAVSFPLGIAVGANGPNSIKDLLDEMKQTPQQATLGIPGAGTVPHFLTLRLTEASGVQITPVPYRGGPPAIVDAIAGQIGGVINPIGDFLPLQAEGKLKIVAVSSEKRSPLLPNVPTLAELGYKDIAATEWYAFFMPKGTATDKLEAVRQSIVKVLQKPEVKERFAKLGFEVGGSTSEELGAQLRNDMAYWGPIVKRSGFVADE